MQNKKPASRIHELINQFESKNIKLSDRLKALNKVIDKPTSYVTLALAQEVLISLNKEYPDEARVRTLLTKVNRELKS